jgi:cobalt-zinc-cadmium efflux system membrane fusion protein
VTLGQKVKRHGRLLVMDSLQLGQLRSSYLQAKARVDLAQQNFDREQRLHERRIASGREKLQAETTYREARIELDTAREQLRLLGLSGERVERQATTRGGGQTSLVAPVAGTIVALHAVQGERVSPETSVVTVADLSHVWVWADVYERDLGLLLAASQEGGERRATIEVAAFPGRRFEGVVDNIGAVMEESTRTVKVRVVVDNAERLLRPGMFASVVVDLGERPAALVVPAEAVMSHEGSSFVFVNAGPELFVRRDVTIRPAGAGQVALVTGVQAGEEVVVRGAFLLKSDVLREQMGAGCAH